MNPAGKALRAIDRLQQRFGPAALVIGVLKKFGDDNAGVLVAYLTYTAFITIFPLLLVLVTILGLVATLDPGFREQAISAVSDQVPLIGRELTSNVHQLRRSSLVGLIAGLATLIWGTTGVAQAGLFTMEQVWNLPGPQRLGFLPRLYRSLLFLALLGVLVIVTTTLAALSNYGHRTLWLIAGFQVAEALVNASMFLAGFRTLTPRGVPTRDLIAGSVLAGLLWTVLQVLGTYLVHHFLHSDSVYGVFGTVLGLVAWLFLACRVTVYSAELNVVLARRLWPRSLAPPPLTEADRAAFALQALQNQRRREQEVTVTYTDREPGEPAPPTTPTEPGQISPPAPPPGGDPAVPPPPRRGEHDSREQHRPGG